MRTILRAPWRIKLYAMSRASEISVVPRRLVVPVRWNPPPAALLEQGNRN